MKGLCIRVLVFGSITYIIGSYTGLSFRVICRKKNCNIVKGKGYYKAMKGLCIKRGTH